MSSKIESDKIKRFLSPKLSIGDSTKQRTGGSSLTNAKNYLFSSSNNGKPNPKSFVYIGSPQQLRKKRAITQFSLNVTKLGKSPNMNKSANYNPKKAFAEHRQETQEGDEGSLFETFPKNKDQSSCSYFLLRNPVSNFECRLIGFINMVGKHKYALLKAVQKQLITCLKAFLSLAAGEGDKRIVSAIRSSLMYVQKKFMETEYIELYNTGFAISLIFLINHKVDYQADEDLLCKRWF